MDHTDTALEMPVGRYVLIICARGAIVGETQSFPIGKVHIEQALVGPVEADPSLCQS